MAKKKKENTLSYLQMPLPEGRKYSKMTKVAFGGLNKRYTHDSGELSKECNISTNEYPYLTPSSLKNSISNKYETPIGMSAFDDFILVVYSKSKVIYIDYITKDGDVYTGILKSSGVTAADDVPRSIVQFNVYDTPTDPLTGQYVKKLLVFPDKKSMFMRIVKIENDSDFDYNTADTDALYVRDDGTNKYYSVIKVVTSTDDNGNVTSSREWTSVGINYFQLDSMSEAMPSLKYATVHLSRVFGVDDDRVYASGYNDYTNWNLDTIDEYNESNAWCSPSQSNTKAGGNFTGITTFQNHIICFKRDFMHEIYNNKNPFRIQDIYAEGTIDNRTIQDVDGKLIFVSEDDVKVYTGSNPRIIGYNLNMPRYEYAVSGTDNRSYYLYCEDDNGKKYLYVYDTFTDMWSEQSIESRVINFAHNKNGMYMLCEDGNVYKMDTADYSHKWSFETDLITNKTVDIKHIKKLQMLVDVPDVIGGKPNVDESGNPANMQVYILYDDEEFDKNSSHLVYSSNGKQGKFPIRVKPRKTANYGFKLHFEGAGYVKLYELEIFIEAGGDLYA